MKRSMLLLLALLLALSACLLGCKEEDEVVMGEFIPPPFDADAVQGTPEVPDGLGWNELDVNGVYQVSVCGVVHPVQGKADIYLTNPAKNNVWLKVRIMDAAGQITYAETGLVKPGEYVQSITFKAEPPAAGTAIVMRVMSYEPETYYSRGEAKLKTAIS